MREFVITDRREEDGEGMIAAEEAERSAYREELERLQEYVSMGEGI